MNPLPLTGNGSEPNQSECSGSGSDLLAGNDNQMKMSGGTWFRKYCESTSLHGWQYIYHSSQKGWRLLWMGMVLSSVIIAFFFVFKQTSEFTKATVVTTVDTTTAPLTDVFFPAVTICNINQVSHLITTKVPDLNISNFLPIFKCFYWSLVSSRVRWQSQATSI